MLRSAMFISALSCVLSCTVYSQAPGAPSQSPTPNTGPENPAAASAAPTAPAANPAAVAADQSVITLKGACDAKPGSPAPSSKCVSSVSKEQFEKLAMALKPDLTAEQKRTFAQNYAKLLVFADAARSLGLENDPKVQETYKFVEDQILLEAINQHYSQEYAHPTDQQVEDYYKQNTKKFTEATIQRVIIPRIVSGAEKPKPSDAEEKEYVEQIREKWVGGADPAKLQDETMEHAGVKAPTPDVNVGAKRPGTLPVQHEAIFDMKAGEVSQPFSDASAFYLYKVVSVREIPFADAKQSIATDLSKQLMRDKMESIANSVTPQLNDTYFGPAPVGPPPGAMARPGGPMSQGGPPRQAPPQQQQAPPQQQ